MEAKIHFISAVANVGVLSIFSLQGNTKAEHKQLAQQKRPWMASTHRDRPPGQGWRNGRAKSPPHCLTAQLPRTSDFSLPFFLEVVFLLKALIYLKCLY